VLVVASPRYGAGLRAVVEKAGAGCTVENDGEAGWRSLAEQRPGVVLIAPDASKVDLFMRRLRDEYMGTRPRLVLVTEATALDNEHKELEADLALRLPTTEQAIAAAIGASDTQVVDLSSSALREMLQLTALSGSVQETLDHLARRLMLLLRLSECLVLATVSEHQWLGSVGEPPPKGSWPELWNEVARAVNAHTGVLVSKNSGSRDGLIANRPGSRTRFAVALPGPSGTPVGALCGVIEEPALVPRLVLDALGDLGGRLGQELSWRSIHDRVAAERDRLRETSMLDPLLGVLSRSALEQSLAVEIGRARRGQEPLAVAVIDVKGLRHINDHHGHVAGDAVLQHVATTTREILRGQDIVGRYGGDEIAILLASTPASGAMKLLERVRTGVSSRPVPVADNAIEVEIVAGVAEVQGDEKDGRRALSRAAAAAVSASRRGGQIGLAERASPRAETRVGEPQPTIGVADRLEAGSTLSGMYQIVHEISRGAMGVVYRAEDLGLSRPVAIKMLRPDLVRDPQIVQRFRDEAAVLARLRHENLVQVYALGEQQGDVYFVMELVEGVSLEDAIDNIRERGEWMRPERIAAILGQIADALDTMHNAGVLHRDVKPGNVVLDRTRDRPVLVDVGLARHFGGAGRRGEAAGTPGFIAPETFQGKAETPATDVYALAASAYAMIVGTAPFGYDDDYQVILRRQLEEPPDEPSSIRPDLPPSLDPVLLSALSVDPADRPGTAGELARLLRDSLLTPSTRMVAQPAALPTPGAARALGIDTTLPFGIPTVGEAPQDAPMTRGVVFRSVPRVLGHSDAAAWVTGVQRKSKDLARAMSPQTTHTEWVSGRLFFLLLREIAASGRNVDAFATELAKAAVAETFRRFYPASPESLSPESTLEALDLIWRRYHSWGIVRATDLGGAGATIEVIDVPLKPGVCAFVQGLLEQVIWLSGCPPIVEQRSCARDGDERCEFTASWLAEAQHLG